MKRRFDSIGLNGGINTYGYVGGNPVNRIDPLGLWAAGFSFGVSTINPFTSGGGGAYGINFEYTSDAGFHIYTYATDPCQKSDGFELGGSATANFAAGNGSWEGPFEQVDGNVGAFSFGQFDSPGGNFNDGYYGAQGGVGFGAPFGIGTTTTNYQMVW